MLGSENISWRGIVGRIINQNGTTIHWTRINSDIPRMLTQFRVFAAVDSRPTFEFSTALFRVSKPGLKAQKFYW